MKPILFALLIMSLVALLIMSLVVTPGMAGPTASSQVRGVQVELRLNKAVYSIGESIEISLGVTNPSNSIASIQFPTGQMHDFIVLRDGQLVWRWSFGRFFTQAFTTLQLQPSEVKVFSERWDQRDTRDQQVLPGDYEIILVFPATGALRATPRSDGPRVRFRIVSESSTLTPKSSVVGRSTTVAGMPEGEVLVNGRVVLRMRVAAGGLSPPRRAEIVTARLQRLLTQGLKPKELRIVPLGREAAIMWRSHLVLTVDANHARLHRSTPHALAMQWVKVLSQAISGVH